MRIITEAMEYILSLADENSGTGEERYIRHVNRLAKAYALCSTTDRARETSEDIAFFKAVKTALRKHFTENGKSPQEISGAINQMVSKAIAADGVIDIFEDSKIDPDMSILSEEFLEEVKHLQHKNLAARTLEQILKTKVKSLAKKNLVKSKKFSEMLDETINRYRNRAIETKEVIEELIKLARIMNEVQNEENDLGLNEDEVAFYDALGVNDAAVKIMGDEVLKKIAVELTETIRNSATIDWNSRKSVRAKMKVKVKRKLQIAKDTFIDDKLKKKMSDMLYKVDIGGKDAYVYLLFEHKSYFEIQTPVQLLGYMCDIWDLHWQQYKNDILPVIVPILIYHGERDWDKGDRLANVLEKPLPAFEKFVPDYKFLLYNLSDLTEEDIKGNIKLKIFSYLFSKIYSRDLKKALENVIPLLLELHCQNTAGDYILTVLNYITNIFGELKTIEDLKKEVGNFSREGREMVMTFTQEAIKQGKIENMKEMLEFTLEVKFGIVSKSLSNRIEKIDSYERLQKMKDAIKTSDTLDEFEEKVDL